MPNVLSNKNALANRNALIREKLAREMTHDFSASGVPNDGQRLRDLVNDARGFVADISPGYGDVLASQRASQAYGQAWDALKGGDIGQAMGRGAEGLAEHLSIIPGIGDIATMGKAATGMLPGLVAMARIGDPGGGMMRKTKTLRGAMGEYTPYANVSGFGRKSGTYSDPEYYSLSHTSVDGPKIRGDTFDDVLSKAKKYGYEVAEIGKDGFGNPHARLVHKNTLNLMELNEKAITDKWKSANDVYVRYGRPPLSGRSKNYIDGTEEDGVSVFKGKYLPESEEVMVMPDSNQELGSYLTFKASASKDIYVVEGDLIGIGSDGEPLLANTKIVKKIPKK